MQQKLIKISDTHYIVVDDSKIDQWDFFYVKTPQISGGNIITESIGNGEQAWADHILTKNTDERGYHPNHCKKITHSTLPVEPSLRSDKHDVKDFVFIKSLSISDVKEAINGYDVEKMAFDAIIDYKPFEEIEGYKEYARHGYVEGFNAHRELVKDKLFTVEEVEAIWKYTLYCAEEHTKLGTKNKSDYIKSDITQFIKSLLPKTEWNVEFINNKIKLI